MENPRYSTARSKIPEKDSYTVLVDIEHTIYPRVDTTADAVNSYIQEKYPETDIELTGGDLEIVNADEAVRKFSDITDWGYEPEQKFLHGHGDWPGLHEVVDTIWMVDHGRYSWLNEEHEYEPFPEARAAIEEIQQMDRVSDLEIVTSRGNWYTDTYDLETAIARKVAGDFPSIPEEKVIAEQGDKEHRGDDILVDDSLSLYKRAGEEQLVLVPLPQYNGEKVKKEVDTWVEDMDEVSHIIDQILEK
ncbi:MAG: hypothetical protein ACI9SF_000615 [Candidatus Nanohaloarchaea archaeon]|jgi:hypothetical protein